MKILLVSCRFPYPLIKGDKLTVFYHLKYLSKMHTVTLFSLGETDLDGLLILRKYCREIKAIPSSWKDKLQSVANSIARFRPVESGLYISHKAKREFKTFLQRDYDLVIFYTVRPYPLIEIASRANLPIFINFIDALSLSAKLRSMNNLLLLPVYFYEYYGLRIIERRVIRLSAAATITSPVDQQYIGNNKIYILPNGVELPRYRNLNKERHSLLFLGNMSYFSNVHGIRYFVKKIYPKILCVMPGCKLYIVGAVPSFRVKKLASHNIVVTGWVERKEIYFNRCEVFIAPIFYKTGIQDKVLEAMAAGLPVVTTSVVNAPINATPGKEIIIADDPEIFAQAVISLLRDSVSRDEIGNNARIFVQKNFSWKKIIDELNMLLETIK